MLRRMDSLCPLSSSFSLNSETWAVCVGACVCTHMWACECAEGEGRDGEPQHSFWPHSGRSVGLLNITGWSDSDSE